MDIEKAKYSPSEVFKHPDQVLHSKAFTKAEKKKILLTWKNEAEHIYDSEAENMLGGEERLCLQAVNNALIRLEEEGE